MICYVQTNGVLSGLTHLCLFGEKLLGQKYNLLPTNYGLNISLLLTTLQNMEKSNWYTTWPKQQVPICTDNLSVQIPVTK